MERWIGSRRRELLDRTLIRKQRYLITVLGRSAHCQMTSPTWTTSASGGATAPEA